MKQTSRRLKHLGKPPGTLEKNKMSSRSISVIEYNKETVLNKNSSTLSVINRELNNSVLWINFYGLPEYSEYQYLQSEYNIHSLILEDIDQKSSRPKCEDHEQFLFFVLKMIQSDYTSQTWETEHVSMLLLKDNILITFQEKEGDVFNNIRKRIGNSKSIVRNQGADYLSYAIIDTIVDNYYHALNILEQRIETTESDILTNSSQKQIINQIIIEQKEIAELSHEIKPMKEVLSDFIKTEDYTLNGEVQRFLQDVKDHQIEISEQVELLRERTKSLMEMNNALLGNHLNQIMKVLTILSSIFIPMTFIAGIYGMNFKNIPELESNWGYYITLGVMGSIAILMLIIYKTKKWF